MSVREYLTSLSQKLSVFRTFLTGIRGLSSGLDSQTLAMMSDPSAMGLFSYLNLLRKKSCQHLNPQFLSFKSTIHSSGFQCFKAQREIQLEKFSRDSGWSKKLPYALKTFLSFQFTNRSEKNACPYLLCMQSKKRQQIGTPVISLFSKVGAVVIALLSRSIAQSTLSPKSLNEPDLCSWSGKLLRTLSLKYILRLWDSSMAFLNSTMQGKICFLERRFLSQSRILLTGIDESPPCLFRQFEGKETANSLRFYQI